MNDTKRTGQIQDKLEILDRAIAALGDNVERLDDKLGQVKLVIPEPCDESNKGCMIEPPMCQLASDIHAFSCRIGNVSNRINQIIHQIEL